jgi:uncharacterized protein YbaP (TraB family)
VVYLLGSIHVASDDIYPLDSALEDAFTGADYLVVEVDTTMTDDTDTMVLLREYGMYRTGSGLKQDMPEDVYNDLDKYFGEQGLSLAQVDQFRPWVILVTLEQLVYENLGYSGDNGIDEHFLGEADDTGKPILELESMEFQFEVLSSISDDIITEVIKADLDDMMTVEDAEELFTTWGNGDREAMEQLIFEGLVEYPDLEPYYTVSLDERNYGMLEKIENYLASNDTYFIVVGAGHLVGEEGLLQLLEDRGYKLEQVSKLD